MANRTRSISRAVVARLLLESGKYDGMSLRQVAKVTGVPFSTLHRADLKLRIDARKTASATDQVAAHLTQDYQPPAPRVVRKCGGVRGVRVSGVYFAGLGESGPIKIGRAADISRQLAILQANNPERVTLLGWVDTQQRDEIQCRFQDHRIHGDWFHRHPDILAFIKETCSAGR